jgi:hypothetical protein
MYTKRNPAEDPSDRPDEKRDDDFTPGGERLGVRSAPPVRVEEEDTMTAKKHLRGVGEKEQRQYEHIKENAKKSGRYGKRAEEVAARTVMKQHKKKGHKKAR